MKGNMLANITRTFNKTKFKVNQKSPEILIAVGIVSGIATCVMACRATLKINEELEQPKKDIEEIKEAAEKGVTKHGLEYSIEDSKSDLRIVYTETAVMVAKHAFPVVLMGGLSIFSVIKSHQILATRYARSVASFKAIEKAFKGYRSRVVERFGPELDRELYYNIKPVETKTTVTNPDGTTEEATVVENKPNELGVYSFIFDEACREWRKDPCTNYQILRQAEKFFTHKLRSDGHLMLNDVRTYFNLPATDIGYQAGWIYDKNKSEGDNYVSLGLKHYEKERTAAFINGLERNFLIDPNCQGYILDKLPKR